MRVEATRDDAERLSLILPGDAEPVAPTHWSFGQLCIESWTCPAFVESDFDFTRPASRPEAGF